MIVSKLTLHLHDGPHLIMRAEKSAKLQKLTVNDKLHCQVWDLYRIKVDANVKMYLKPTCDIYGVEIIALTPGVPILM